MGCCVAGASVGASLTVGWAVAVSALVAGTTVGAAGTVEAAPPQATPKPKITIPANSILSMTLPLYSRIPGR